MQWQEISGILSQKKSATLLVRLTDETEFTAPAKLVTLDGATSTIGFPIYRNGELVTKLFGKNKGRPDLFWMACSNISEISFI